MDSSNGGGTAIIPANSTHEQGFGVQKFSVSADTAAVAAAAQTRAMVEARFIMADRRKRDWDEVRRRILDDCRRHSFAEVARYRKPVGEGHVEGWSIRFAESAIRAMTNVLPEVTVIYDDPDKRIVRVSVTDLEANVSYAVDVTIEKTVERSNPGGRDVIRSRQNTKGRTTYTVRAEEDDLLNKVNAQISKALRTSGMRLLPGDIQDDALRAIRATLRDRDTKDPAETRKRLIDAFADYGVTVADLKSYIGRDLNQLAPAELQELRDVYAAIKTGEARWHEFVEQRQADRREVAEADKAATNPLDAALDAADPGASTGKRTRAKERPVKVTDAEPAPSSDQWLPEEKF